MVTLDIYPTANGYWSPTSVFNTAALALGLYSGEYCRVFINWGEIRLPPRVTITSAYVSLYKIVTGESISTTLYFNDTEDATSPTTMENAEAKVLTSVSVNWDIPASSGRVNSGDCSAIIQELVNSYDYNTGNKMMTLIYSTSGTTRSFFDDEADDISIQPILHIEYTLAPNSADYIVSTDSNDGTWRTYTSTFATGNFIIKSTTWSNVFMLWTGITIPYGAIITDARLVVYLTSVDTECEADIYFNDTATPVVPTGYMNADAKVKTTSCVSWAMPIGTPANRWFSSDNIASVVQELVNSYDYSSGASMMMLMMGKGTLSGNTYFEDASVPARAPILYIEYILPEQYKRGGFFKF